MNTNPPVWSSTLLCGGINVVSYLAYILAYLFLPAMTEPYLSLACCIFLQRHVGRSILLACFLAYHRVLHLTLN